MSNIHFNVTFQDVKSSVFVPVAIGTIILCARVASNCWQNGEGLPDKSALARLAGTTLKVGTLAGASGAIAAVWNRQNPGQEGLKAFGTLAATTVILSAMTGKDNPYG